MNRELVMSEQVHAELERIVWLNRAHGAEYPVESVQQLGGYVLASIRRW